MIEAHHKKSIRRERACAGVAAEKGLGAEGRGSANPFLALRKISAVLSQKCGELSDFPYRLFGFPKKINWAEKRSFRVSLPFSVQKCAKN